MDHLTHTITNGRDIDVRLKFETREMFENPVTENVYHRLNAGPGSDTTPFQAGPAADGTAQHAKSRRRPATFSDGPEDCGHDNPFPTTTSRVRRTSPLVNLVHGVVRGARNHGTRRLRHRLRHRDNVSVIRILVIRNIIRVR